MNRPIIIRYRRDPLCGHSRIEVVERLRTLLAARAEAAYMFGSFVRNELNHESDFDLIVIVETKLPFVARASLFESLRDWLPSLQILVYTPDEFEHLTNEDARGFWTSVRAEMIELANYSLPGDESTPTPRI